MTEQQACTLCGAGGHTAAQCNWNDRRLTFTLESLTEALGNVVCLHELGVELIAANVFRQHPEQAEGAQGEREVTPNPSCSMCSGNGYFCEFSTVETCWCCLPEPEPEETVEALKERIESLKAGVTHMKQQRDAAVARAALAQPSPAPELADELALIRAVMNGYSPSMARADGLRAVGVIDRIVGALQADRESWEQQAADRVADWDEMRQERDAAQARVAELIAALERAATAMWNSEANMDNEAADAEEAIGNAKSGAPFAQAGQVPEVSGIARAYDHPSAVILYLRKEPTDDDLRAIQEGLRVLAAAPQPAKGE